MIWDTKHLAVEGRMASSAVVFRDGLLDPPLLSF